MRHMTILALLFVLAACGDNTPEIDRTDPRKIAEAYLTAYQSKDITEMADFVSEDQKAEYEELAAQGADHPRYADYFEGWQLEAITKWPGVGAIARIDGDEARVQYAHLTAGDIAVLVLNKQGDAWMVSGLERLHRDEFKAWGAPPQ